MTRPTNNPVRIIEKIIEQGFLSRLFSRKSKHMTRIEFIKFLKGFRQDLENNNSNWENRTLEDFLEAMEAYTKDVQGYYGNMKLNIDADKPTWENFKTILIGASLYE